MNKPKICLCVHDDVLQPLKWILYEFNKDLSVTTFKSATKFETACQFNEWDLLILDAAASEDTMTSCLQKIRSLKPAIKITLIVPPVANRDEVVEIIKSNMVQGLVIKPFSAEIICKYLAKELSVPVN